MRPLILVGCNFFNCFNYFCVITNVYKHTLLSGAAVAQLGADFELADIYFI